MGFEFDTGFESNVNIKVIGVGGAGTNALVFTGTVTAENGFKIDTTNNSTINNEDWVNYTSAVSGTVKDILGH